MINHEKDNLIDKAALDVMMFARSNLLVRLRFLDMALSRLELVPSENATLATDGVRLFYGPLYVLRSFRSEQERPTRDYLHILLHCIFSHMFAVDKVDRELWDAACDIAVENTINDLDIHATRSARSTAQRFETERLKSEVKLLTAEKIYHYLSESDISEAETERLKSLFSADDHSCWYRTKDDKGVDEELKPGADSDKRDRGKETQQERDGHGPEADDEDGAEGYNAEADPPYMVTEETEAEWKDIAEKVQEALETLFREHGDAEGGLIQNLNEINREKYDYTTFLRKFSVLGENPAVNDEEFDYIFYTYGLQLYGNMPLVEPLEYKEVRRVREFVIAIDTSGSTSGELVQKFLQKTFNILKSTESYFSRVNIHIIQCDAAIQEHVRITSEKEFDRYIREMSIHGLGGTDFRPVFSFVDRLIEEGEFNNLKGMIYFTDGFGTFPARKPRYDTAFVFLDNEYNNPDVPPWAIRLILQSEDI